MPTLMIIDDEPLIRRGLEKMIIRVAPEWHVRHSAENGMIAVRCLEKETVDLILADIRMPEMDGLQFLRFLSESGNDIPVIILTGYNDFEYARTALRYGAYDYLLKPIQESQIKETLARFASEKYIPIGQHIDPRLRTCIEQYEFELMNALESRDARRFAELTTKQCTVVSEQYPALMILNQTIRVVNTFLRNLGIYGFDYATRSSPEQLPAQMEALSQQIEQLMANLWLKSQDPDERIIEKAQAYIRENLQRPITLLEVAEHVHYNPTYFSEYFRMKTGETFSKYVIRQRMEEAKRKLVESDEKVSTISEQLGYQDTRYFSKLFKLMVGMTPSEYRMKALSDMSLNRR